MMNAMKEGAIIQKQHFDARDYKALKALEQICQAEDQTSLKLELEYKHKSMPSNGWESGPINEFMYWVDDQLVGYLGICSFGGSDIEVNGMVHPAYRRRGIFKELFHCVKEEWFKRKAVGMLLLSDSESRSGRGFIESIGAVFRYAEFEMEIHSSDGLDILPSDIQLRQATNADADEIARQNRIYFDDIHDEADASENEKEWLPESEAEKGIYIYLASLNGTIIGKIHLEVLSDKGAIYGFGVLPEFRKNGFGRQILNLGIDELFRRGCPKVMLQVVTENMKALDLYLSTGFEVVSKMNYYAATRDE